MTTNQQRIDQNRQACQGRISLDPVDRNAFTYRAEQLIQQETFPNSQWYNDEDFIRAYQTACYWRDEADRLTRELHRQRVKLANRGALIVELWQGMQAARQWIRGEFRDGPLGDPAARSWACLWCGEMLTGREHAKQHCEVCPESPLVRRIQELKQQLRDPEATE